MQHLYYLVPGPRVRTPTVGAPGWGALRDILSSFSLVSWMANEPRPCPTGTVLRFGSLESVATGNDPGTDLLPPGANPNTQTPPPRCMRRSGRRARHDVEWLSPAPPHGSRLACHSPALWRRTSPLHRHQPQQPCSPRRARLSCCPFHPGCTLPLWPTLHPSAPT